MHYHCYYSLCSCILLFFFFTPSFSTQPSKHNSGFTTDLIHRDSPQSPFHDPSETKWARLANAITRSTARIDQFKHRLSSGGSSSSTTTSLNSVQSSVVAAKGEYLMNLSIGTPPVKVLGIVDTGSDLVWIQCEPCVECYKQNLPIFDPKQSSSFRTLPCNSPSCYLLGPTSSCNDGVCSYYYSYGDESHTFGDLASETLTFDSSSGREKATIPKIVVGCGHDNNGNFNEKGSGLVGLGGGKLSLVRQIRMYMAGKFSYCLTPFYEAETTSKISFGSNAVVAGPSVVSTPLVKKEPETFYYVTIESISVGDQTLNYYNSELRPCRSDNGSSSSSKAYGYKEKGNIIIDSGTTLTFLPEDILSRMEEAVDKAIEGERTQYPESTLSLCYKSKVDIKVPVIKVQFEGGKIELKSHGIFVRVEEEVVCFAMAAATNVAIFGNLAQSDYLVGYDLEAGKVSFKPADCSKLV